MTEPHSTLKTTPSWPITLGAECMAAAQFARCGFDVLVQPGRDKSWYDLAVTRAGNLLKVSVKGSEDGRWSLAQSYTRRGPEMGGSRVDCRGAIDMWLDSYGSKTICCLVQFEDVAIGQLPRIYLAFPHEIAAHMRQALQRTGQCGLFERYEWLSESGQLELEMLPLGWRFSMERIQELINQKETSLVSGSAFVKTFQRDRLTPGIVREVAFSL